MKHAFAKVLLILGLLGVSLPAASHEARPAYLQLHEIDAETFDVFWKVPGLGEDRRLAIHAQFAPETETVGAVSASFANNAFLQRWRVRRHRGFDQTSIRIDGLEATLTDTLVRVERLDGTTQTVKISPSSPSFMIEAEPGKWEVARAYLALGIEHILLGIDHLLFVLALMILVRGAKRLLWTITAFTVAHSLTLAAATLGWIHVPVPPVEASIALSIVFLAAEIARTRTGHSSLTYQRPWIVAFVFGLLHGLGFASALSEVGLPANAIPVALLFFNLGVETGQLVFVACVLAIAAGARRLSLPATLWNWRVPVYAIGAVASCWTFQRIAAF
jgi:hydrogenase/urease accessory protein HupE